jgi:hypothetical protein
MARFVEEEGLDRDEKVEGIRGMLDGLVEVSFWESFKQQTSSRAGTS